MSHQMDSSKQGLHMFFKDWEHKVLEHLWSIQPRGATSREVQDSVLQSMSETISRASVINFLHDMAQRGALTEEKITGKGGYRGVYYQKYNESEYKQYLAEHFIRKLLFEYPGETRKIIKDTHQL